MDNGFLDTLSFSEFKQPTVQKGQPSKLIGTVSVTVCHQKSAQGYALTIWLGTNILKQLGWEKGTKIQAAVSKDGRHVCLKEGQPGWSITHSGDKTPSQMNVTVSDYYLDKKYVRKVSKREVKHMLMDGCLVVDIKEINRLAQ